MGDRGNIGIQYDGYMFEDTKPPIIYFYSHYDGDEMHKRLAKGLDAARGRWDDEPYLARIIFDNLTGLSGGQLGYGISPYIGDNSHDILIVSTGHERVWIQGQEVNTWTFQDFIELVNEDKFEFR